MTVDIDNHIIYIPDLEIMFLAQAYLQIGRDVAYKYIRPGRHSFQQ